MCMRALSSSVTPKGHITRIFYVPRSSNRRIDNRVCENIIYCWSIIILLLVRSSTTLIPLIEALTDDGATVARPLYHRVHIMI